MSQRHASFEVAFRQNIIIFTIGKDRIDQSIAQPNYFYLISSFDIYILIKNKISTLFRQISYYFSLQHLGKTLNILPSSVG